MRFFETRVHGGLIRGRYFITSESDLRGETRAFSIREALPDGSIRTIGAFMDYPNLDAARHAVRGL